MSLKKSTTTPWFNVCQKCGTHGKFILRDGSKSGEVYFQEQGVVLLKAAYVSGFLTDFECGSLMEQLKKSKIPTLEYFAKQYSKKIVEEILKAASSMDEASNEAIPPPVDEDCGRILN